MLFYAANQSANSEFVPNNPGIFSVARQLLVEISNLVDGSRFDRMPKIDTN